MGKKAAYFPDIHHSPGHEVRWSVRGASTGAKVSRWCGQKVKGKSLNVRPFGKHLVPTVSVHSIRIFCLGWKKLKLKRKSWRKYNSISRAQQYMAMSCVVLGCVNQETSLCFCTAKRLLFMQREKKSSQKLEKRKKKKINKQQKMSLSPVYRQPQSDF